MSLADELKQAAQKMAADPRILKLMQSEQVLRLLTLLVEMPERVGALSVAQGARFARNFHLATRQDVERLERRIADIEAQLAQERSLAGR